MRSRRAGVFIMLLLGVLVAAACTSGASAQNSGHVTIMGTVFDSAHRPVGDASVRLEHRSSSGAAEMKTSVEGTFAFSSLHTGSYRLSAEKSGMRSGPVDVVASAPNEERHVELILSSAVEAHKNAAVPGPSSSAAMEFADQPNFTVAGVTDWTAVGGHGSDANLRASEALARETLTLKPEKTEDAVSSDVYDLVHAYEGRGDFAQAREQVQKMLTVQPNAELYRMAGELDEKLGDPLAAVHAYEQAVQLDPSERNYFEWGSELLLHRAVWQAQAVFGRGSQAYPKSTRMLTALGAALFAGALYDKAALRLCAASDLSPADPEPYLFMGRIEIAAPDPLPCIEQKLARFVRAEPGNSLANYFYAMAILKQQGQTADPQSARQAEALLTTAVTIDSKCGDAYLQLGILSTAQRHLDKAIDFYTKAIEANPQLGEAHYRLAVAYDRIGETAKAKQEFTLHDEIEKRQADAVEAQRREVKQFMVEQPARLNDHKSDR